ADTAETGALAESGQVVETALAPAAPRTPLALLPERAESLVAQRVARIRALRDAITDANGNLVSDGEIAGIRYKIERVERLGYRLEGSVKYSGNQGIDLVFSGGPAGRFALAEAKASRSLSSLKEDVLGIRQGSREFFATRLQRGGRLDLLRE